MIKELKVNDVKTDKVKIIADGLNRYFSEVGANIIAELENESKNNSSCRNTKFSKVLCKNSIFTSPTDKFEIYNIFKLAQALAASFLAKKKNLVGLTKLTVKSGGVVEIVNNISVWRFNKWSLG